MPKPNFEIDFKDNSDKVLKAFYKDCRRGLERIGMKAEGYAAALTPVGTPESTGVEGYIGGTLRQSMTHKVVNYEVYVGTNIYYAPYVEYGTGIYATDGTGRKSPWMWVDKNGVGHWTRGMKPNHMLLKAVTEHNAEYEFEFKSILKD